MTRKEMVPADSPGLCGPEWKLLCWIRREIKVTQKLKTTKATWVMLNDAIIQTMNENFSDWPEDPK